MKRTIALLLLFLPGPTLAEAAKVGIYKSLDADGNIVYSDTPSVGAEKITPPPISTIESGPGLKPSQITTEDETGKPPTRYTRFSILQPKNDDTLWDSQGSIPLSMKLEPGLDTGNGHSVWVYIDGKPVVKKSASLVQPISGIDRGTHKVSAEIRDGSGRVLKRTKTISVHVKKHALPIKSPK